MSHEIPTFDEKIRDTSYMLWGPQEDDTNELMRGRVKNPSPIAMGPNMGI
jgi:hypothetical protein